MAIYALCISLEAAPNSYDYRYEVEIADSVDRVETSFVEAATTFNARYPIGVGGAAVYKVTDLDTITEIERLNHLRTSVRSPKIMEHFAYLMTQFIRTAHGSGVAQVIS